MFTYCIVMQYMGIVECVSSGRLYVDDIISHGYMPLIINVKIVSDYVQNYRRILSKELEGKVEFIDEDDDFNVFISRLKKYDLVAVFPGSEHGVRLADRICSELGLRGNDAATTHLRNGPAHPHDASLYTRLPGRGHQLHDGGELRCIGIGYGDIRNDRRIIQQRSDRIDNGHRAHRRIQSDHDLLTGHSGNRFGMHIVRQEQDCEEGRSDRGECRMITISPPVTPGGERN